MYMKNFLHINKYKIKYKKKVNFKVSTFNDFFYVVVESFAKEREKKTQEEIIIVL